MKLKLLLFLFSCFVVNAQSQVGISTDEPKGTLHVTPTTKDEVLILSDTKSTSAAANSADGASASYLQLKISDNGVLRREVPASPTQSAITDLGTPITITTTPAKFLWYVSSSQNSEFITLPETGSYIFSFRLYAGFVTPGATKSAGGLYVITGYKDGSTTPLSEDAIYLVAKGTANNTVVTYTYNATVSGSAGDKIYFTINRNTDLGVGADLGLIMRATPGNNANKTSLLYWKIPAY